MCCFLNCFVIRSSHTRCLLREGSKSVHSVFEHVALVVLLGLAAVAVNAGFTTAQIRAKNQGPSCSRFGPVCPKMNRLQQCLAKAGGCVGLDW